MRAVCERHFPAFLVMWLKQCHVYHPVITISMGGISTIKNGVVYCFNHIVEHLHFHGDTIMSGCVGIVWCFLKINTLRWGGYPLVSGVEKNIYFIDTYVSDTYTVIYNYIYTVRRQICYA